MMNRLFHPDNPVMQFLSKIFDLMVLNFIFILSCIPIITIGAAISSLYYVNLKMLRGEDPYIFQNYVKAFKSNLKQGTVLWLLSLLLFIFLGLDFYIVNSADTALFAVIRTGLWVVSTLLFCIFLYLFPVISHFVCTTLQALKNAAIMAVAHLPYTLLLLLLHGGILFFCARSIKIMAFAIVISGVCGFSVVSFTSCIILNRIFKKYEPGEETRPAD